ncbi:MAG TPA: TetR/AcrR family transcriptional regulator [Streptosporangiaceae bacterium]|jgi:AcrR family transcriptional regulator
MPKVSQQYRNAQREHILAAARRCFLRDGFHATSMQDLFAEAGLSSGAVYGYFASKDEMIMAIAEENAREVLAAMHAAAARHPGRPAGEALADALEIILARDAQDGLGAMALLVWAEALRSPGLAAQFRDLFARLRADLAAVVRDHQDGGGLPGGVSAEAVATVLLSVVPGCILQLALAGPEAVAGAPRAVRALWP